MLLAGSKREISTLGMNEQEQLTYPYGYTEYLQVNHSCHSLTPSQSPLSERIQLETSPRNGPDLWIMYIIIEGLGLFRKRIAAA